MVDKNEKYSIINNRLIKGEDFMLAKYWKRILFFILIVACLFNIMSKIVKKTSVEDELQASAEYMEQHNREQQPQENKQ